ncbi:hypothetical protein BGW80DRAFT_1254448 [Lactifluus volemus]|nr:hypothetical protein BGW80DRAFT_1254448 [Lactifluus volemus]
MNRHTYSLFVSLLLVLTPVHGHERHSHTELPEEVPTISIDSILWIHIFLQATVWGILFPIGMIAGIVLTLGGYILGHAHGGRGSLAHGLFANILLLSIAAQGALGVYLKLHIHELTWRPWPARLGTAALWRDRVRGYCGPGFAMRECIGHFSIGGSFTAYGVILAILLLVGEMWIRRSGRSPDWWDSWVIVFWCNASLLVNTLLRHPGGPWDPWLVEDMQHTTIGILWWCGVSSASIFPGIIRQVLSLFTFSTPMYLTHTDLGGVISAQSFPQQYHSCILTGFVMTHHEHELMLLTTVHAIFGYTLILAALRASSRSDYTLADGAGADSAAASKGRAFRHMLPFLLVTAGLLLTFGTAEELQDIGIDYITFMLIVFRYIILSVILRGPHR